MYYLDEMLGMEEDVCDCGCEDHHECNCGHESCECDGNCHCHDDDEIEF